MCETEVRSSTRTHTVQTLHTASWYQTNQQQRVAKKSEANDRARHTPRYKKFCGLGKVLKFPPRLPEKGERRMRAPGFASWSGREGGREGATMISSKQCHAERCSRKRPEQQVTFLLPLSRCTTVLMCVCFLPSLSSSSSSYNCVLFFFFCFLSLFLFLTVPFIYFVKRALLGVRLVGFTGMYQE